MSVRNEERKQNLVGLLRLKGEGFVGTCEGIRGDGDGVSLMPHSPKCRVRKGLPLEDKHGNRQGWCTCWMRSMLELERCLREMRSTSRPLWYAIHERYIAADRRRFTVTVKHWKPVHPRNMAVLGLIDKTMLNTHGNGESPVMAERWNETVKLDRVDAGLELLAAMFKGTPELPVEMVKDAA